MALLTRNEAMRIFQDVVSKRMDDILEKSPSVEEVNIYMRKRIAGGKNMRVTSQFLATLDYPDMKSLVPKMKAVLEKKYLPAFPDCKIVISYEDSPCVYFWLELDLNE